MPDIFTSLFPSAYNDAVAVFTQDFMQIFRHARAIKATVKEQAKVMEQPIETGAIITDHRIILPIEVELSMILTSPYYEDTYKSIREYYLNGTLLVVQTKAGVYSNLLISSIPHEEDPAQFNALSLALSLKEVLYVTPQYNIVPRRPHNSNTVNRGTQQGSPANQAQSSFAASYIAPAVGV